jgi:hypothetical protein
MTYAFHQALIQQDGAIVIYFAWGYRWIQTSLHVFDAALKGDMMVERLRQLMVLALPYAGSTCVRFGIVH